MIPSTYLPWWLGFAVLFLEETIHSSGHLSLLQLHHLFLFLSSSSLTEVNTGAHQTHLNYLQNHHSTKERRPPSLAPTPNPTPHPQLTTQLQQCLTLSIWSQLMQRFVDSQSLKPGEDIKHTKTADKYSIKHTTLARRHQGVSISCTTRGANQRALRPHQKQEFLRYKEHLAS